MSNEVKTQWFNFYRDYEVALGETEEKRSFEDRHENSKALTFASL